MPEYTNKCIVYIKMFAGKYSANVKRIEKKNTDEKKIVAKPKKNTTT